MQGQDKKEILHAYVRVSSDKSAKKDNSIPAQITEGQTIAGRYYLDFQLHREGDLNTGTSATKDDLKNRPVLSKLLEMCETGEVKHIFYTEPDRVVRNPYVALEIKGIFKKNGILFYTDGRRFDIKNNDEDEFWSDFKNLLSEREIRLKNKRIVRTLHESARKGKWSGGVMLPYGYRRQEIKVYGGDEIKKIESGPLEFHPDERQIVLKMYRLSLEGKGSPTIARILNEEGVLTKGRKNLPNGIKLKVRGGAEIRIVKPENLIWRPNTVLTILKNPLYKGERHYKGEVFQIEPMIEPDMWEKVQSNLRINSNNSGRNNKVHFYLLKGLIVCKKCNKGLYGIIKPKRNMRVYYCVSKRSKECDMKSVNIERLDELVWDHLKNSNVLFSKAIENYGEQSEIDVVGELEKKIKALNRKIDENKVEQKLILNLYGKQKISEDRFDERNNELLKIEGEFVSELNSASTELKFVLSKKQETHDFADFIAKATFDIDNKSQEEKKEILNRYVKQIIVDYDKKSLKHTITLELNFGFVTEKYSLNANGWAWEGYQLKEEASSLDSNLEKIELDPIATQQHR